MTSQNILPNRNRYPGVKPFTPEEGNIFFGRKQDIESLYSLIFIRQTVVLYGKSGYGKSSLINAGIIPKLKEDGHREYFTIRFNNYTEKDELENISPVATVISKLSHGFTSEPSAVDKLIDKENSFWYWIKRCQDKARKPQFILFFDQFEELFTYPKEFIDDFSEQLSQLLYNTIPVHFRKRVSELDEQNELDDNLHDLLYDKPDVKVVFSIRSDRVSMLNILTNRHPTILQNMYELNALDQLQARQAIIEPASLPMEMGFGTAPFSFTEEALKNILEKVSSQQDGKIETATLQIICRYIEDELVPTGKERLILADQLGNISDIFQKYYENVLQKLSDEDRPKAQRLIEDELIESGRRNLLSGSYIQKKFGVSENLLKQMEQSSLLRKERDAEGRLLYEVSHDSLVAAIEKVAKGRWANEEESKRKELELIVKQEQEKSQELQKLKIKAVQRSRIAIGLTILTIVLMVFEWMSLQMARTERNQAEKNQQIAEQAQHQLTLESKKTQKALYESNIQKVRMLVQQSQIYISSEDYMLTCQYMDSASKLLNVDFPIPQELQGERIDLQNRIESLLQTCKKNKKTN